MIDPVVAEIRIPNGLAFVGVEFPIPESLGDVEIRSVSSIWSNGGATPLTPGIFVRSRGGILRARLTLSRTLAAGGVTRVVWSPDIGAEMGTTAAGAIISDVAAPMIRRLVRGDVVGLDASDASPTLATVSDILITLDAGLSPIVSRR